MFQREPGIQALRTFRPATIDLRQRRMWYEGDGDTPPDEGSPPAPDTPPGNNGGSSTGTTFTQADVDRIVGERAKRAKESGIADFLKELGFEKPDDLKSLVTDARKRQEDELSEAEKLNQKLVATEKKLQEAEAAAQQAVQSAREEKRNSAILAALTIAEKPQSVLNLLLVEHASKVAEVMGEDGALDSKKIEALAKTAQTDYPGMFKKTGPGSPSHAGGTTPTGEQTEAARKANLRRVRRSV